jgi:hypothetical protein
MYHNAHLGAYPRHNHNSHLIDELQATETITSGANRVSQAAYKKKK